MQRGWILAFALMMASPTFAEKVYLRNRLLDGKTVGSGRSTQVNMEAFAKAMGLKITQQGQAYVMHPASVKDTDFGVSDQTGVFVVGRPVESSKLPDGTIMISLWDAATAAGFKVTPNPALGTIDVNVAPIPKIPMPVDDLAMSAPAETSPSEASGPKPTRVVKSGNIPGQEDSSLKVLKGIPPHKINKPGAAVNVQEHLVPGRYNLVVFGADW